MSSKAKKSPDKTPRKQTAECPVCKYEMDAPDGKGKCGHCGCTSTVEAKADA